MPSSPRFLPASGYDAEDAKRRIGPIVRALARAYPGARTALAYDGPFQLLAATILSAQSTDETVNRVTPALFRKYPSAEALAEASPDDVEKLIYPSGFFRQKTKSIIGCAKAVVERFDGAVPGTMAELITLPGVARKTANVVLANCRPQPKSDHGIFVDTHIRRISLRLALTRHNDPNKIERDLCELIPKRRWAETPHQLILLGRGPCNAKAPRHDECPLLKWCPTGQAARAEGVDRLRRAGRPAASRRPSRRAPR